ncbi:hypothetical protein F5X97DRAFT_324082 [Nemania serpens]|nr:hypothetical protein F5X97DRAFT_324082 [Nemania serpens]
MSAQATFRARYTDEDMLVGQLLEIFPGQRVQIKEEDFKIERAIAEGHYDTVPPQVDQEK